MSTATGAALRYNPYDYEIHEDPYPTYRRLRAEAPVYRNDELGFWALSRHADVTAAFRDSTRFSSRHGVSLDPAASGPHAHRTMSFLAMDPPRHTRMRALVSRGFTPRRVVELEDRIRALTVHHLEAAIEQGSFDFVGDFAGLLPMDVISELMGVPPADRAELRRLADLLVHREEGVQDVPRAGVEAALVLAGYYADMISQRRSQRTDDLTSALIDAEIDGDRLTDDEITAFLFLMVVAGNETTTKLLANAWYWAWRTPEAKELAFGQDPDEAPIDGWVEETLRYDASTQMLTRLVTEPVELHGTVLQEGDTALLLVGSANRDEAVFEEPDSYDLTRDPSSLVSFGVGRHFCLGASLARLETRICLEELVRRIADYEIDAAAAERFHSINVRGFAHLPTTVVAR
ncbi:MAG: cytochrome P450 [Acidobacteria bacterium]|nr:cytochrome P450 [Acidobacteriota bacterium]